MLKSFVLISLLLVAGCISGTPAGGGLNVIMQPDPPKVFSHGITRINIDLENSNPRTIKDVSFSIFDTGRLSFASQPTGAACGADIPEMTDQEFMTFFCLLRAPEIEEESVLTEVNAKASYRTALPVVQVVEMMTENEYIRRQSIQAKPQSYSYKDKNVEVLVEFSEPLPIVIRQGRRYFIHFTVKNIGNGLIDSIKRGDFTVAPAGSPSFSIADCRNSGIDSPNWRIEPAGKEFPRITCELAMPGGVAAVENYGLLATLNYRYEVREKAIVQIVK